jgi:acyl-coenzyme A thioesterase PaaI-like protein
VEGEACDGPRSLRELFDQLGLTEVPSTEGTVVMEMPVDERTVNFAAVD